LFEGYIEGREHHLTPYSRRVADAPWSARGFSKKLNQADNPALAKSVGPGATRLKPVRVREYKNVMCNTARAKS